MFFTDAFDMVLTIKFDLNVLHNQVMPISMMSDTLSLSDSPTHRSSTIEKCLKIDLKLVKNSHCKMKITDVESIFHKKTFVN